MNKLHYIESALDSLRQLLMEAIRTKIMVNGEDLRLEKFANWDPLSEAEVLPITISTTGEVKCIYTTNILSLEDFCTDDLTYILKQLEL